MPSLSKANYGKRQRLQNTKWRSFRDMTRRLDRKQKINGRRNEKDRKQINLQTLKADITTLNITSKI